MYQRMDILINLSFQGPAAAAMWPPDPDPDPDPKPAGRSHPSAVVPRLRALLCSLKGRLLLAESGLSFITFVCYVASSASAFLTAPLLEFLLALFFLFADAMQLNDKWQGLCWPMMVRAGAPRESSWLAITENHAFRPCPFFNGKGVCH